MFPGASIHNDLRLFVASGLTPYQALSAGTRTAGRFVSETVLGVPMFGTITEGARADLILLEQNPLADVAAASHPVGVMVGGEWWTAEALRAKLDELYEGMGATRMSR